MIAFLEKYLVPVAARFGSQRHMVAVRDAFAVTMPFVIAGSFAVLINNAPIPGYTALMDRIFTPAWTNMGGSVFWGTMTIISLMLAFSVAYHLAESYKVDALNAGILGLACFTVLLPQTATLTNEAGVSISGYGYINSIFVNSQGMFIAILVAIISTEVYVRLTRSEKLVIKMPENVPPAVSKSFAALFPTLIVLGLFGTFYAVFGAISGSDVISVFNRYLGAPLQNMTDSLGAAILIAFMNHILWFFGLHGSNIIGSVIEPLMLPILQANMDAVAANKEAVHIVTKSFFDSFVYLGGSGATISLLIAVFIAGKRKQNRLMAELGIGPGLFNINETVIFGFPLILNPLFVVPFILGPVVLTVISYFALDLNLVPKTIAMVPWTTPPIIGGFIAVGSWKGAALALFNLVLSVLMYMPFVIASERIENEKESSENLKAIS